ncbi:MAG: hypothetical protein KA409_01335 [Ferruginibacter sp.]|nr:hypothetical protein [Chitinophagaceae bacterium]MBP6285530.1 hypothetical protein [Ferruginibacter sp.]
MKWLHFILSHSFFVSFCAVALAFQTGRLLHVDIPAYLYGFIFFATLCSYNFYWILSRFSFSGTVPIAVFLEKEATGISLFLISLAGMVYFLLISPVQLNQVAMAVLLTVAYSVPLLPFKFLHFTRKAGVLKTVLLAFTWTYVTAFLPMQTGWGLLSGADIFILTRRFLFMLMLCIIFDNRDKAVDKIRGLHSLATVLKPNQLLLLITVIFIILFGTNFLSVQYGVSLKQSIALQTSTIALLVVYFFSTRKQGYLFYYFVVDGLMLFSALATFVAGI